jgi:hypothetical protein
VLLLNELKRCGIPLLINRYCSSLNIPPRLTWAGNNPRKSRLKCACGSAALCLCVSVFHTTLEFTHMFYDLFDSTIAPVTRTFARLSGSINFHPQDIN